MGIHQWKFSDRVDPNLICSVCREVFENPVRTPCGHVFCRQCVSEWLSFGNDNCPECRKVLKEIDVSPDRIIASLIGNLVVHCRNGKEQKQKWQLEENIFHKTMLQASSSSPPKSDTVCKEAQSHDTQEAHHKSDTNGTAISTLKGSPKSTEQDKNAVGHIEKRPKKKRRKTGPASASPSSCSGEAEVGANVDSTTLKKDRHNCHEKYDRQKITENGMCHVAEEDFCTWKGKYSELESHVQSCAYEKVVCTHNLFGCSFSGMRSALPDHLKHECIFEKVKHVLYAQKKELDETRNQLLELQNQHAHVETVLAAHTGSWLKEIEVGTKLDAKDKFGRWYEGTIIALHGENQVRVHFDGWNSNFDELIVRSAERLAPLHLHSIKRKNKRKAQRRFRDFEDGDIIDCKDTMGDWYESVVLDVKDNQVLIHYEGWPNVWDEWIDKSSSRLAPYRTHSLRVGVAHPRLLYTQQQQQQQQQAMLHQRHRPFVGRNWF